MLAKKVYLVVWPGNRIYGENGANLFADAGPEEKHEFFLVNSRTLEFTTPTKAFPTGWRLATMDDGFNVFEVEISRPDVRKEKRRFPKAIWK